MGEKAETYIFGSAARGELTAASDIDILIISDRIPINLIKSSRVKLLIMDNASLPLIHPFELYLVNMEEAEMYRKYIGREMIELG